MVWHCEQCRRVLCKWVDTDTAQYMELLSRGDARIVQARVIFFDALDMVVYINPVDDPPEEHYIDYLTEAA